MPQNSLLYFVHVELYYNAKLADQTRVHLTSYGTNKDEEELKRSSSNSS